MKRFILVFGLLLAGFAAFADVVHTTYKDEDWGDVFVEYDNGNINKGLKYKEEGVLVCQAHLCQFYSKDFNVNVANICYQSRDVDNYGYNAFVYKITKKYGWLVATVDNTKLCYYNVDDNTVAAFSIELYSKD